MEKQNSFKLTDEEINQISPNTAYNINIGVLGHIDSGKTSLAKSLSEITSTASLDKNPQSQERGITLDLGFSAFFVKKPEDKFKEIPQKYIQFTLVDCPGHASLIKTIIGGASIIDIMFLVIDINKGIQTQTAECLVIGELLMQKMIVILNKIDLIPEEGREAIVNKKIEALRKVFLKTKFGQNVPMVPISAMVNADDQQKQSINIDLLIETLLHNIEIQKRNKEGQFFFLIDHCFPIKGQGSVVTGTVISGQVKVGAEVQFPQINQVKKIKSMQMFKKPVDQALQGDRIGMLFTQLDNKLIERGIACEPGAVQSIKYAIIPVNKVIYFKFPIKSKAKFHITSGHQTVMATIKMFSREAGKLDQEAKLLLQSNFNFLNKKNVVKFDFATDYEYVESFDEFVQDKGNTNKMIFAILEFEKLLVGNLGQLLIGSKFDSDVEANVCRLGFFGNILEILDDHDLKELKKLKIFRNKFKKGIVEKVVDNYTVIVKDMFKKESNINIFIDKPVILKATNNEGKIEGSFGKSGKIKVRFDKGVYFCVQPPETVQQLQNVQIQTKKIELQQQQQQENQQQQEEQEEEKKQDTGESQNQIVNSEIFMKYKKYLFNK